MSRKRIDMRELAAFRHGTRWFIDRLAAFAAWDASGRPEPIRPRRRRVDFMGAVRAALGARKLAAVCVAIDSADLLWLFAQIVQTHQGRRIGSFAGGWDTEQRRLRRFYGTTHTRVEIDGKPVALRDTAGVLVGSEFAVVRMWSRGDNGDEHKDKHGAILFAREQALDAAVLRFRELAREHSIYRRRFVSVNRDGFHVVSTPALARWDDVVAVPAVFEAFQLILRMAAEPTRFSRAKVPLRCGVLVAGPPGTGKTLHCGALARSFLAHGPVFLVSAAVSAKIGLPAIYRVARSLAPALVIIEDADTIARSRDEDRDAAWTLGELLLVLDAEERYDGVYTVLTTNYADRIDRAIAARPGRIDRVIRIPYPDEPTKWKLLAAHAAALPGLGDGGNGSLREIPAVRSFVETDGITGDHIRALVTGAAARVVTDGRSWKDALELSAIGVAETVAVDRAIAVRTTGFGRSDA